MAHGWTAGVATAIGIGVGAALASSFGPVGYLIGLTATLGPLALAGLVQRVRRS